MRYRKGIRLILSSAKVLICNFEFFEMVGIMMYVWVNHDVVLGGFVAAGGLGLSYLSVCIGLSVHFG